MIRIDSFAYILTSPEFTDYINFFNLNFAPLDFLVNPTYNIFLIIFIRKLGLFLIMNIVAQLIFSEQLDSCIVRIYHK